MPMPKFRKMRSVRQKLGKIGERCALRLLRARNAVLLARNWRSGSQFDPYGELDLVVLDGGTIVFVEVKTRRKADNYDPRSNLHSEQLKRIRRGAAAYCREFRVPDAMPRRMDLVEVIHNGRQLRSIVLHENFSSLDPAADISGRTMADREGWINESCDFK